MYPGFIYLTLGLDAKHLQAVTTNLQSEHSIKDFVKKVPPTQFISVTCSWHREGYVTRTNFAKRALMLRDKGFNTHINIVNHESYRHELEETVQFFKNLGFKTHVSPWENPLDAVKTDKWLICNAGLNTFTISNTGDVYRCLTWFRSQHRDEAYMGNLFSETFKPFQNEQPCRLRCDIYYTLDSQHEQKHMFSTYVRPLHMCA